MTPSIADSPVELLELVVTAALSVAMAVGGTAMEVFAVTDLTTGQTTLGAWELAVGALLLYGGVYLVGYQRLWAGSLRDGA